MSPTVAPSGPSEESIQLREERDDALRGRRRARWRWFKSLALRWLSKAANALAIFALAFIAPLAALEPDIGTARAAAVAALWAAYVTWRFAWPDRYRRFIDRLREEEQAGRNEVRDEQRKLRNVDRRLRRDSLR